MLSRSNYQTYEPDYTPAQKIAIFAALVFALVMVAIAGKFALEFIRHYHEELNRAVAFGLIFLGVLFLILCVFGVFSLMAMVMLHIQNKRLMTEQQRQTMATLTANNQLFLATAEQMRTGQIYLTEQRTSEGVVRFKSLPKHQQKQPKPERIESIALPIRSDTPEPEPKNTLLSDIEPMQRLLIVGGQNSGKTTLLKHIAHQRSAACQRQLKFDPLLN